MQTQEMKLERRMKNAEERETKSESGDREIETERRRKINGPH